ncbi:matrixin family metalloprotease [Nocardioides sp. URHA0020]|uniref:matrixin family metalloprotease n=1 Tax=Nocardioides sp. URHA0020 TaxID=1380392 RepID=UPI0006841242|nr:matrixin family metalloprotease [Nocardioides sp. URHA0020]
MPSRSERSRQRRAAREIERALAELDRLDREHGLGTMPGPSVRRTARDGRGSKGWLSLMVASAVLLGIAFFAPTAEMQDLRRLVGLDGDRVAVPDGDGSYAFLQTQPQTQEPVGYDPCRTIEVEVNPDGAPKGYSRLVDTGISHTAGATGLSFERVGTTDRRPSRSTSGQRQPVLIAWADAREVPELKGDVAGIGGSTAVEVGFRDREYVTGEIVLDTKVFDELGSRSKDAQAIVDHEFGHLVGLDHVDDRGELMYPENSGRTTYGPGDLEGLAKLGNLPC